MLIKPVSSSLLIPNDLEFGIIFLFQTSAGLLGNSSLLGLHLSLLFIGHTLKPLDHILSHLCSANILVLLSKGVPQSMTSLGVNDPLSDMGCKLLFYLHRVARGTSLCTTCLLSGFQAITVSSGVPRWAELKTRASEYVVVSCYTCWFFNFLLHIVTPLMVAGPNSDRNITWRSDFAYCTGVSQQSLGALFYILLLASVDFMFLGLMVWSSGSMVVLLRRHRQHVQHVHSKRLNRKTALETRATHTILLMVCTFVVSYSLSSILAFYMAVFDNNNVRLFKVTTFVAACFPTACSFVLTSRHWDTSRLIVACGRSELNSLN